MYTIGMFSKISKTTIKTLRYYDQTGLMKPEYTNEETGYRYYSTKQLVKLQEIISLRQTGLTIEEIKKYFDSNNSPAGIKETLKRKEKELEGQIRASQAQLSRIRHQLGQLEEENKMKYQAIIKQTPECIIYSKKLIAPNYESYFKLIPEIGEEVKKSNPKLKCAIPEYCFIAYLDGEYKEKDINIEYCEAVEEFGNDTETIKFRKLPSIQVVSVLHKGPYRGLREAYSYAFRWIEENGYIISDSPRENYIDGIWNKENEQDWLTELQIPIKAQK